MGRISIESGAAMSRATDGSWRTAELAALTSSFNRLAYKISQKLGDGTEAERRRCFCLLRAAPDFYAALNGLLDTMERPRSRKARAAWDYAQAVACMFTELQS
jgi:hypothetical protein